MTERGLACDRSWMIVGPPSTGRPAMFVTQREYPRLALVRTRLDDQALVLSAPGATDLAIAFDTDGPRVSAVVWRDTVSAIDQGDAAAAWISAFLGVTLRIVRFDPAFRRLSNGVYAGDSGAHTAFADGYPLLVVGSASLSDLNDRLLSRGVDLLPMNRFRPNLVLDGLDAYDEDHLSTIDIGDGIRLRLVKPCVRCRITTTDQDTAQVGADVDNEPLATLASYRNDTGLGGVTFGINAIVERGAGTSIARGAAVSLEWNF